MPQMRQVQLRKSAQPFARIRRGRGGRASLRQAFAHRALEDRHEQVVFAAEIQIHRPGGDAGGVGDVRDLRVEKAALGEHVGCGTKDGVLFCARDEIVPSPAGERRRSHD